MDLVCFFVGKEVIHMDKIILAVLGLVVAVAEEIFDDD